MNASRPPHQKPDDQPVASKPSKPLLGAAGSYLVLGWQIAFSFIIFTAIGYALDAWLDTLPWFLIGGILFGLVTIFAQLYRLTVELNQQDARRKPRPGNRPSSPKPRRPPAS